MSKIDNNNLITLRELGEMFGVKKSSLIYYTQMGILVPDVVAGKTALFDKEKVVKKWDELKDLRESHTLSEIREILNQKNVNRKK